MDEKVSIIIPVYNVEPWINKCVDSVLKQTYSNLEIILINDGSTDNSSRVCDYYKESDNRVIVIHNQNFGLSHSRNVGIEKSTGKYLMFIDSDDYICDNNVIKKFVEIFKKEGSDFIYSSYCRFEDGNDDLITEVLPLNITQTDIYLKKGIDILDLLIEKNSYHHAAYLKICNREFLISNRLFFKEGIYHEDAEWSPKIFYYAKKVSLYRDNYYMRRMRQNSIITSIDEKITTKKACDRMRIAKELINFLKNEGVNPKNSLIIKDLVKMYWGDLMIIPKIRNEENLNKCCELINKTKYVLKYEKNIKYKLFIIGMSLVGTKNLIKLVGSKY